MNNLTASAPNQITFLADTKTHKNRFDIPSSDGSKSYRVAQAQGSGEWQCSCPAWIYAKGGRKPCKHLNAMSDLLLQIEGAAPAAAQVRPAPAQIGTGRSAARAQIESLVRQAEREAADARAKAEAAEAKLAALRVALQAA